MSSMPGNHYGEFIEEISARNLTEQEGEAIMALAFEQRTANLIALAALHTANGSKELGEPFIAEATERLGMNGGH